MMQHKLGYIDNIPIRSDILKEAVGYNYGSVLKIVKTSNLYIRSKKKYLQNDIDGLKAEFRKFHPLG